MKVVGHSYEHRITKCSFFGYKCMLQGYIFINVHCTLQCNIFLVVSLVVLIGIFAKVVYLTLYEGFLVAHMFVTILH